MKMMMMMMIMIKKSIGFDESSAHARVFKVGCYCRITHDLPCSGNIILDSAGPYGMADGIFTNIFLILPQIMGTLW